ncbi:MerR family transcriptional regulator [Streptomyces sp. CA-111067]|uniref:MerR family transcriptional regulator n=1 Tax=Streptomyces sp. CA-111067 TaxID=3240046 RepID=UPI003D992456
MSGDTSYTIGELARRTGLTVKTVRFYSDRGIVPPAGRSPAGHRRYDTDAVARLDLVRTLRDLGLDLATVAEVLDRRVSLPEAAAAHAEALEVRIRTLRLRQAVLAAVARRGSTLEETELMHRLAALSEAERRRLTADFLAAAFGGLADDPRFAAAVRSLTPELPEDPEPRQVEAWVELAELAQDPGFRAAMRRTTEDFAADLPAAGPGRPAGVPRRGPVATVRDLAAPALAAGVDPGSAEAGEMVAAVAGRYARDIGTPDGAALRGRLLHRLESAEEPRRDRYLQLLAVVNGWTPPPAQSAPLAWFIQALRARR